MKKIFAMMVIFGVAAVFMAGCGKKEEPASALGGLKKMTNEAQASGEKAAADAKKSADKATADAKKAAAAATK